MGLLLAGAGTVYLYNSESKRTSPAVRTERFVWNTHTASSTDYSDKAVQLAREVQLTVCQTNTLHCMAWMHAVDSDSVATA